MRITYDQLNSHLVQAVPEIKGDYEKMTACV